MNHTELTARVSQLSGLSAETCQKVLDAFEQAISESFSEKNWKTKALVHVSRMLNSIRERQENRAQKREKDQHEK
ncbi:MAG: hypothetical protein LUD68_02675 [Rikenellaceae bacterium]|nr:hypothetical protein [Rikenellaceae bacterium]